MEKNDYFVIIYRILAYLYACLKEDAAVDFGYLSANTKAFPVGERYWNYIFQTLLEEGYIRGVSIVPVAGCADTGVKLRADLRITPKGIEYLQENSMMAKAKDFLKGIKEIIPGL